MKIITILALVPILAAAVPPHRLRYRFCWKRGVRCLGKDLFAFCPGLRFITEEYEGMLCPPGYICQQNSKYPCVKDPESDYDETSSTTVKIGTTAESPKKTTISSASNTITATVLPIIIPDLDLEIEFDEIIIDTTGNSTSTTSSTITEKNSSKDSELSPITTRTTNGSPVTEEILFSEGSTTNEEVVITREQSASSTPEITISEKENIVTAGDSTDGSNTTDFTTTVTVESDLPSSSSEQIDDPINTTADTQISDGTTAEEDLGFSTETSVQSTAESEVLYTETTEQSAAVETSKITVASTEVPLRTEITYTNYNTSDVETGGSTASTRESIINASIVSTESTTSGDRTTEILSNNRTEGRTTDVPLSTTPGNRTSDQQSVETNETTGTTGGITIGKDLPSTTEVLLSSNSASKGSTDGKVGTIGTTKSNEQSAVTGVETSIGLTEGTTSGNRTTLTTEILSTNNGTDEPATDVPSNTARGDRTSEQQTVTDATSTSTGRGVTLTTIILLTSNRANGGTTDGKVVATTKTDQSVVTEVETSVGTTASPTISRDATDTTESSLRNQSTTENIRVNTTSITTGRGVTLTTDILLTSNRANGSTTDGKVLATTKTDQSVVTEVETSVGTTASPTISRDVTYTTESPLRNQSTTENISVNTTSKSANDSLTSTTSAAPLSEEEDNDSAWDSTDPLDSSESGEISAPNGKPPRPRCPSRHLQPGPTCRQYYECEHFWYWSHLVLKECRRGHIFSTSKRRCVPGNYHNCRGR